MTKLKKLAIAATVSAAVLMPLASHASVVIDGVKINAGDQIVTTAIYESVLTSSLASLSGVGIVSKIACAGCGGVTWLDGANNTQLTYYFGGYTVAKWYDQDGVGHAAGDESGANNGLGHAYSFALAKSIDFTGGFVNLYTDRVAGGFSYLDPSANPNAVNPVLIAQDIANATDGNLWLSYVGVTTTDISGRIGTLFSDTATINPVHAGGSGFGYLNVVAGGLATGNFDTDSFNIGGVIADARLDSSFSTPNSGAWPLSGTAAIKTTAIPEPGSLALIGLGLAGMGVTYRRKSAKKA